MRINLKDFTAGAIFIVFGGYFLLEAALRLKIGTPFQMGPGFFPIILGGLLILFGLAIAVQGMWDEDTAVGPIPWRALLLITAANIVFGASIRTLGLVPAVALTVLLAGLASRRMKLSFGLLLTIGLTVFCVLVFVYGLGLSLPLFSRSFGG